MATLLLPQWTQTFEEFEMNNWEAYVYGDFTTDDIISDSIWANNKRFIITDRTTELALSHSNRHLRGLEPLPYLSYYDQWLSAEADELPF